MAGALQIVNTFKQGLSGGGAFDDFAVSSGDSLTFATFPDGAAAYLAEVWAVDGADSMVTSLTASRFHDREFGIEGAVPFLQDAGSNARASLANPSGLDQPIYSADVLTVRGADQNAGDGNIVFLLRYANLPGINARLATADAVRASTVNLVGVQCDVDASSGAGQGQWSDQVALSAGGRRLDAGKYYAIVGFNGTVPFAACSVFSFETGNLRVGAPIVGDGGHDSYSLYDLSRRYNETFIPVIRGDNQDSVQIQVADPAVTTGSVFVQLAELSGPIAG
jgi:hypothetical protein